MIQIDTKPVLASMTSLRLGGKALAQVRFSDDDTLDGLLDLLAALGGKVMPLGGGSNILAADGALPFVLLVSECTRQPQIEGIDEYGHVFVRASAGLKLPRLLAWCASAGLGGLEGMAGIPGTVGGAVAGNAGAMGSDMGRLLRQVSLVSSRHGTRVLPWCAVRCGYRSFEIPDEMKAESGDDWFMLRDVIVALRPTPKKKIIQTMREHVARKIKVQPVHEHTAGCVFKNPDTDAAEGLSAGQLLEAAGFRGKGHGGMRFSAMHANFLSNEGRGTATAALDLIYEAQQSVLHRYGVALEMEVKVWSC